MHCRSLTIKGTVAVHAYMYPPQRTKQWHCEYSQCMGGMHKNSAVTVVQPDSYFVSRTRKKGRNQLPYEQGALGTCLVSTPVCVWGGGGGGRHFPNRPDFFA